MAVNYFAFFDFSFYLCYSIPLVASGAQLKFIASLP